MMTCCTFVYSVINLIQSKQQVFSHSLSNYQFIEIIIRPNNRILIETPWPEKPSRIMIWGLFQWIRQCPSVTKQDNTKSLTRGNQLPVSATRCQFHQHFMGSFCAKILSPKFTDPNCKYIKAAQKTFVWKSCS